jgi:ATP-dependent DNA ligase
VGSEPRVDEIYDQPARVTDAGSPTNDLPRWIKPQLTKLVEVSPEGSDWVHEIKFDGDRRHAGSTAARSNC